MKTRTEDGRSGAVEAQTHCDLFGFTDVRIAQHLELLGLTDADDITGRMLRTLVIEPRVEHIVNAFYDDYLLVHPEFARAFPSPAKVDALKRTQTQYLRTLGRDFATREYFNHRLAVGVTHCRVGLPLSYYEFAYCKLRQLIHAEIPESVDRETRERLSTFIAKITSLDMSLAIEAYHNTGVHALKSSLDSIRGRHDRLIQRAQIDGLTGVVNRDAILERLRRALASYQRDGGSLAVLMVDIDNFRLVNDGYGHLVGDHVMRSLVGRVTAALRSFDVIGRYGGDEFLVLLENTALDAVRKIAARVAEHVAGRPLELRGGRVELTVSQGIACAEAGEPEGQLLARVDEALRKAKAQGGGRICVA